MASLFFLLHPVPPQVCLTTDENVAFQLRCWVDLSNVPCRVRQGSQVEGGLLTKVGLLSSLTALSMKFALGRCFSFLRMNLGLYTKSRLLTRDVFSLQRFSFFRELKAAVFG